MEMLRFPLSSCVLFVHSWRTFCLVLTSQFTNIAYKKGVFSTMAKLSSRLKALVNAPAARPHTVPAPRNIRSVYQKVQEGAQANEVSQRSWLALSVRVLLNSPES